jgi:tetratricopeptide (TPR) repeat protein
LELDRLSNRVVDLLDAHQFDAAKTACDELQAQYPDEIDWLMRRAMLHEALGQATQAIEFYQRTLAFMADNPEGFDADSREPWQASLDELQRTLAQSP